MGRIHVVRPLNIALLCDYGKGVANTIIDHIEGLVRYSAHHVVPINFRGHLPSEIDLNRFDGLIIHYSLIACNDHYLDPAARVAIRNFPGLKIAFVQDDYRFIDKTVRALRAMGVHILFGLVPEDIIDDVYAPSALPGVRRETVLAGYVPEDLLHVKVPPLAERPIDIGYRARKLPAWLGSHGQEKWRIAERVLRDADRYRLRCDVSWEETDRLYGDRWITFLSGCKAVLGTESGAGLCDFTGEIQIAVEAHVSRQPEASFETLRELYFKEEDGRLAIPIISPRCFEAAALRTLMILYEGHYSGRLQPWRHYLPLRKDHSNMDEIVAVLRDADTAQAIVDRAYQEVALNRDNWFESMVRQMDRAIEATFKPEMRAVQSFYSDRELAVIGRKARKRAHSRQWLRKLHVAAHVRAVRSLDVALMLLPRAFRHSLRKGLRRQFHRARRVVNEGRAFHRQLQILRASGQPGWALANRHFRSLLKISREVGAEQDVHEILRMRAMSSSIKNSAVRLAYDADSRRCRIELVERDPGGKSPPIAETITPFALGQLIERGLVDRYSRHATDNLIAIDQSLADDRELTGLASIANIRPEAIISLVDHVCEQPR